ncbi:hypothetical protein HAN_3g409 (nucleomorph) [Hemiselmis andersenii]|uniref:Kinetochore protein Nuf2 N-terminal domain-containing protein n=2 Tax=Hemiselmis andersenii TaxID=464988 RepID=A9BL36_HEMAN|nr:hypothetical protein HAN_3g409 [Hemiselmis andersenii]ABW98219.1 hypothetical protein HAN_3g409 [Hemiselmis andersenii]
MENLFPVLNYGDISKCFSQLKIPDFDKNIKNLSQEIFKTILRKFLEYFAGKTFLEIYQPKILALDYLTYPELHEESIVFLTEHRLLQKMVKVSSLIDLWLFDYIKIETSRNEKIISGIINFARFKEKKILNLTKYSKIFFKILTSSFEVDLSLKFLKKKTIFFQRNFPKYSINPKNLNFKKQEQFDFFSCQFFNFYYPKKTQLKAQKYENLKTEKIIKKNKKVYTKIYKIFSPNKNFESTLKKKFIHEQKNKINFLEFLELQKKNFQALIFKYLKKNLFQFMFKRKNVCLLLLKNLYLQKKKFNSMRSKEIPLKKKKKKSVLEKKNVKLLEKSVKKKKFFFLKKPKLIANKNHHKNYKTMTIVKKFFFYLWKKNTDNNIFCYYCLFLIYLNLKKK